MVPLVVMQIAVAAAQDVLFAIAVGAFACGVMLGRDARATQAFAATLGRLRLFALCVLALACCLYLWLQATVMSGGPLTEAGQAVTAVLTQSHYGMAWTAGFVGVLLAIVGGTRASHAAWLPAAAGAIVYTAGKAAASHAADAGDFTLREAVHVVHLCATALWAGSVIVSAFVLGWCDAAFADSVTRRVAFCTHLSHLATIALGVVILTGIYNVRQDTAHLTAPLLSVLYGRLLTLKLALVALAVLLGGVNRMGCLPRLQAGAIDGGATLHRIQHAFDRLLAIEAVAMLAVLIVAAVLGHTSPSGG